jgi:predicted ATPase with chaperone activity
VLFLDEMPEFGTRMLEMLRQPLDSASKVVSTSRSAGSLTYPANFSPITSMNPYPQSPTTGANFLYAQDFTIDIPGMDFAVLSPNRRY